jgi:hypothetical protein
LRPGIFDVFASEDGSTGGAVRPAAIDGLNVPLFFPSCQSRSTDLQNPTRFICKTVGCVKPLHLGVGYHAGPAYLARLKQAGSNPLLKHDRLERSAREKDVRRSAEWIANRLIAA